VSHLREGAKQEVAEPAEGALYIYPKPELETLREQLALASEQLAAEAEEQSSHMSYQLAMAYDANSLTVEALSKGHGGKLQIAFKLLQEDSQEDSQWPQDVYKLQRDLLRLGWETQQPPTKVALRARFNPSGTLGDTEFSLLLKYAGLSWLPQGRRQRRVT
jgi:hypothetical protein